MYLLTMGWFLDMLLSTARPSILPGATRRGLRPSPGGVSVPANLPGVSHPVHGEPLQQATCTLPKNSSRMPLAFA